MYVIAIEWFIFPFVEGKDINIPAYTHMLKKGKDDMFRLIYLMVGLLMCITSIVSPVAN
jgi:hypothetical protein